MFHMTLILADTLLVITKTDTNWYGHCQDNLTGKSAQVNWTDEQLTAVLVLAMGAGEEKYPGYHISQLYAIAEEAVKDWPKEVRPIP